MTDHIEENESMRDVPQPNRLPDYEIIRTEQFRPKFAGFWTRFWAYIIDLLIVSSISGIFIKPVFRILDIKISNPSFLLFSPYKVTLLILFLAYFALMTKFTSQTVGKMILGIKVVTTDGGKLTWGTILFREVIGRFISKLLTIPYLLVAFMPKKESLHDLFADTYVIHEHSFEREIIETRQERKGEELQAGTIV
ncbi:RDD family protein [Sporosarcina sp. ACRSL]|uniref:RDD family protein n=1 Tax=Sporosarcina sp. ACRSL TaxID=2918215 RepID=UPI001EF3F63E|nr:RDD family protein [Sporosarcina sp. ACRSL]MCG7344404.1 RDD family protein [Sporosarcina sp. ACRSL]